MKYDITLFFVEYTKGSVQKDNLIWTGYNCVKEFGQPDGTMKKFGNICWYTNLNITKRHAPIDLIEHYTADKYPKYDNYDAINVDRVFDIPCDYDGVMGVPITFMDKYCPEQFEILGDNRFHDGNDFSNDINIINGKKLYRRLLIKRRCAENEDNAQTD